MVAREIHRIEPSPECRDCGFSPEQVKACRATGHWMFLEQALVNYVNDDPGPKAAMVVTETKDGFNCCFVMIEEF